MDWFVVVDPRRPEMGCPSGKSPEACLAFRAKIFRFTFDPNHRFNFARLTAHEGRLAIVTDVAVRCGGRSGTQDEAHWLRTAKSCGPDAPTLAFKLVMMPCASRK
jgi:hypothetical protein